LVVEDEAAFVSDETYDALLPMLAATSTGRIVLMSTPFVAAGHFYAVWHGAGEWERHEFKSSDCVRISKEWLDQRRREDPLRFGREYCCEFGSPEDSLFTPQMLDAMVANDFEPLVL
jgi:hypothetical protein